jgi:L-alanine-DL-glutamate epimerase-like enolase superfamily enzyme
VRLEIEPVSARLAADFVAGHGSVRARELLLVSLHDEGSGLTGYGEAAPLPSYDGVTTDDVRAALEDCRAALDRAATTAPTHLLAQCGEATTLAQALAAIDLALWDLAGRRAGAPVCRLLGDADPGPVGVNWTIAAEDRAGAAREATAARAAGFETVKVKVAVGDDAGRLAAVRACAGAEMAIRVDANGAWSPDEAEVTLERLAPVGIELCEEPVAGVAAIGALAERVEVPLALDESADDPAALDTRVCEFACLKISRCGGISGIVAAAARARAAGYRVYLASTLDGPLGIAAALHAAAVIRPEVACGLATLRLFEGRADPLPPGRGTIEVPRGPGLGDGLLGWYGRRATKP